MGKKRESGMKRKGVKGRGGKERKGLPWTRPSLGRN